MIVPGSDEFVKQQSDPYGDLVDLAVDLGADGIDADYEVRLRLACFFFISLLRALFVFLPTASLFSPHP